jgi:hypothetical protein
MRSGSPLLKYAEGSFIVAKATSPSGARKRTKATSPLVRASRKLEYGMLETPSGAGAPLKSAPLKVFVAAFRGVTAMPCLVSAAGAAAGRSGSSAAPMEEERKVRRLGGEAEGAEEEEWCGAM